MPISCLACSWTVKMETIRSSVTSISFNVIQGVVHNHHCENLKSWNQVLPPGAEDTCLNADTSSFSMTFENRTAVKQYMHYWSIRLHGRNVPFFLKSRARREFNVRRVCAATYLTLKCSE
jgi:hypothetical protein